MTNEILQCLLQTIQLSHTTCICGIDKNDNNIHQNKFFISVSEVVME